MTDKSKIIELWAKNKYLVMEHSSRGFVEAREYLKKPDGKIKEFENLIEEIVSEPIAKENALKSIFQIWELVKINVTPEEKDEMFSYILDYKKNKAKLRDVKSQLQKICEQYRVDNILESNYFD